MTKQTAEGLFTFFKKLILSNDKTEEAKINIIEEKSKKFPKECLQSLFYQENSRFNNGLIHIISNNEFEETRLLEYLLELSSKLWAKRLSTREAARKSFKRAQGQLKDFLKEEDFSTSKMVNLENGHFRPIHFACHRKFNLIIQVLVKFGADVSVKISSTGQNSLHIACISGEMNLIKTLLDNGTNLEDSMHNGRNPLILASLYENLEAIRLLINLGCNLDCQDHRGFTGLQYAVEAGNIAIFQELLQHHADIEIKNRDGKTVLDIAKHYDHFDICEIISKHKARLWNLNYVKAEPAKPDTSINFHKKSCKSKAHIVR